MDETLYCPKCKEEIQCYYVPILEQRQYTCSCGEKIMLKCIDIGIDGESGDTVFGVVIEEGENQK